MGAPKQLLSIGGVTLAERAAAALEPHVAGLAVLGSGDLPPALAGRFRLADVPLAAEAEAAGGEAGPPASAGPLAGLLAAMRWRPEVAWAFAPCDLPAVEPAAVGWLISQRRPGTWAILPRAAAGAVPEPLLALYEPAARDLLEALAAGPGPHAPRRLAGDPRVASPVVPPHLARCWAGINTPGELDAIRPPPAG
jgi:molybdopterin-guanine dinucleotide biosynthesis protein A